MKNGTNDLRDDPRLTAYALGELEGDERAELERELRDDPRGSEAVGEVRALGAALAEELGRAEPRPSLTAEQRAAIAAAGGESGGGRAFRFRRVAAVVGSLAAAALAVTFFLPGLMSKRLGSAEDAVPALESEPVAMSPLPTEGIAHRYRGPGDSAPGRRALRPEREGGAVLDELRGLGYLGEKDTETYERIVENPFVRVLDDPLSTFSIDVDTASYANVRRFLNEGRLPPADAVRIEELVNYFTYAYPPPAGPDPFSVTTEVAACPWTPAHKLVRIGLKGRAITSWEPKEKNLVFLIDVSGSMNDAAKLPLLKRSMRLLVENLNESDRVAIAVYAGASGLVLPATPCDRKETILAAIEELSAGGSTNGGEGIELAYWVARRNFIEGGINRVILATDGDFNVGVTDRDDLIELIERKAKSGIFLSVLGFGTGNLKDATMEQLADHGNGNYGYIDSLQEARKVLVREGGATLETIAKDVKIQVEFNPAEVAAFRLIGYENRVLAHRDFNDDTKDAGEIGAGHTVTALYEVVPVGVPLDVAAGDVDDLKYQEPGAPSGAAWSGELMTVKLRYKRPDGDVSVPFDVPVRDERRPPSEDFRFAAAVAAFGMTLRDSAHRGGIGFDAVYDLAVQGAGPDPFGYRSEFLRLVQRAGELSGR